MITFGTLSEDSKLYIIHKWNVQKYIFLYNKFRFIIVIFIRSKVVFFCGQNLNFNEHLRS